MNRIIISGIAGLVVSFVGTMATGNVVISVICGIVVFIILSIITDKKYMRQQKEKKAKKQKEKKEERQWKREAYHKEYGRQKAKDISDKEKEYNNYDDLNIKNLISKNPTKKLWGK